MVPNLLIVPKSSLDELFVLVQKFWNLINISNKNFNNRLQTHPAKPALALKYLIRLRLHLPSSLLRLEQNGQRDVVFRHHSVHHDVTTVCVTHCHLKVNRL